MLTPEVKQRINTCRDILVGKLPDPKSQVLQITNSLIYKFMDDQDRLAEKLGGKPSFFVKDLKPYAWHKLFDSKLSNQDKADLYINGIEKLSQAKHLPELFQEIFKEAYVPFRAAGTIVMFIDEINKFDYHHSEELGNAYEYLLSIMGSQGDAGQFRTPRHIIEFIVDVVDPQKSESVYDPAVGTAGFLIAAYKHISEENKNKLTANEKKKLAENIQGVDISPDMAKMARVNLYLHGFTTPAINEGDTLSDEDLWGHKYDVILANPPFMSPKGGIVPHDKFAIKAKRSEVLFVDYIAEHLKLKGRAGIIVPEGIIFQSGTNYRDLRKMLVEDGYLQAVISLPAGVFQPYSGVKTSILILDRERAKENTEILFLKIENDGYTLSSQRTEREGSQIEEALAVARIWNKGKKQESSLASWVTKKEIAESGGYNLTGEQYRVFEAQTSSWPIEELGEIAEIKKGTSITKKDVEDGPIPVIAGGQQPAYFHSESNRKGNVITVSASGAYAGFVAYFNTPIFASDCSTIQSVDEKKVSTRYLFRILKAQQSKIYKLQKGGAQPHVYGKDLEKFKIPLPPIEIQKEIVAELDRYQKIIDGARQVVQNYKPSFKIDPEWPILKVESFAKTTSGGTPLKSRSDYYDGGTVPWLRSGEVAQGFITNSELFITELGLKGSSAKLLPVDTVLVAMYGATAGQVGLLKFESSTNQAVCGILPNKKYIPEYLYYVLKNRTDEMVRLSGGGAQPNISQTIIRNLAVPVPPPKEQKKIIDSLETEREYIHASRNLIEIFEQKIQDKIAEVWGE